MRRLHIGTLALSFVLAMPAAHAQLVIYRCTDASGAVTLQNGTPCPKGSKQQKKVMEAPAPAAAPAPVAPPAVSPPPQPAPVVAPAPAPTPPPQAVATPKQPPPALFECRTWDNTRYFGENPQPPPRCAPMQVTGLDGSNAMAGGAACQMMDDQCQPVAETALCDAWRQRVRELDARATFGGGDAVPPEEAERIRRVLADSTCTP
ncbi:DUF4124 domain-containing protein [Lysobacter soli]|uniref:DUF4124 domain-containing protein n=1 Tax=Lysobacter soli TaxID=453783 RepID=A0A3D8VBE0_9GAMM|nr:DUF4124 domain-containing protein [Lysobacter soli]RDY66754.1 DUF4124 domain-containing protein [Lysobacter soli]